MRILAMPAWISTPTPRRRSSQGRASSLARASPSSCRRTPKPRCGRAAALRLKHGITVLNTPGTIDHGYRGEVGVILINHGRSRFDVHPGMKIAQMVIAPCLTVSVEETGELSGTSRGQGGFGSTGVVRRG